MSIVSSDWHLEEQAWKGHSEICGDSYYSIEQIVDHCIASKQALIGAGDLKESTTPSALTVKVALRQIDRLYREKIPFAYVTGQHEGVRGRFQGDVWYPDPINNNGLASVSGQIEANGALTFSERRIQGVIEDGVMYTATLKEKTIAGSYWNGGGKICLKLAP